MELNANDRTVRMGGFTRTLAATAFGLLSYLVERENTWVRSQEIHRVLLGSEYSPYGSNHRWHIHKLRKDLGELAAWIHGDKRLGYMFSRERCRGVSCVMCRLSQAASSDESVPEPITEESGVRRINDELTMNQRNAVP